MRTTGSLGALALTIGVAVQAAAGQTWEPPNPSTLPPALQQPARLFLQTTRPSNERLEYAERLVDEERTPALASFLADAFAAERDDTIRAFLLKAIDTYGGPRERAAIERGLADANAEVQRVARNKLGLIRYREAETAKADLRQRSRSLAAAGDTARASALETAASALGPADANVPPPLVLTPADPFDVKIPAALRAVVIGDFGTNNIFGKDAQDDVADAIFREHTKTPFNFGLVVGDNFYPDGLTSVDDKRWVRDWETPYGRLGISFHAVPGNHDWANDRDWEPVKTEIEYTAKSPSKTWHMPGPFYTFKVFAGSVTDKPLAQFYALDTQKMHAGEKSDEIEWLKTAMTGDASWKIVMGHHPVISGGGHGGDAELKTLRTTVLLPVIRAGGAHLYVAGHDHELQLLRLAKPSDRDVLQIVTGAAGRDMNREVERLSETLFASKAFGYTVLEITESALTIRFVRVNGAQSSDACACTVTRLGTAPFLATTCTPACMK